MADISRAEALALITEQRVSAIVEPALQTSVVLSTFPTVQMSKKTLEQPMLASLPTAGFVTESATDAAGVKPTTDVTWTNKTMTAEEIAVIVPIHENVLDDADVDLWASIQPRIAEAFAKTLDQAVLYGTLAPASWTDANIAAKAVAAGNVVRRGTLSAISGRTADAADEFNALLAAVEADGFDVTNVLVKNSVRAVLRGLRGSDGQPVAVVGAGQDSVLGASLRYLNKNATGQVDPDGAGATGLVDVLGFALDSSRYQVGIREDFTVKLLDQATVNGINLAERDMVALRFKFRVAFGSFVSPAGLAGGEYPASVYTA